MKRSISSVSRNIRDLFRDQAGATAILFSIMAVGLMGTAGLTIDAGRIYAAKKSFDADTQAAALVGAHALQQANATQSTVQTAVTNWTTANPSTKVTVTNTNVSISCDTATANLPSCNGTTANVANVTRTATVSTNFLKAVGFPSITLTSTSSAAKAGGTAVPLNVMFVLDATGSMGTSTDAGCGTVPGVKGSPSRFQCAEYSIQSVLKTMPTSLDKVGLMIFPGMATQYSPTSHPCTQPNATPYYTTNIKYQIGTTLDATYNTGSGALNDSSPLVQAVGDATASPVVTGCVTAKGGEGSYAAEVLTKAQAALPVVAGTKNVIIFLSDGDFNVTDVSKMSNQTSKMAKQCDQAIAAAQAATAAGTTVYAVAYGASTSGCASSGDTHNPCTTMQAIASDKTRFYSTSSTCQMSGAPNAIPSLPDAFKAITTNLTKPRLVVK
jgi:Flp pilus assembly protein TadG